MVFEYVGNVLTVNDRLCITVNKSQSRICALVALARRTGFNLKQAIPCGYKFHVQSVVYTEM